MTAELTLVLYEHQAPGTEFQAISGHYVIEKEVRIPFNNREIFYTTGYAVVDSSCCGTGGCGYALVHGYIVNWKKEKNRDGFEISQMEAIRNDQLKKELQQIINQNENVTQVNFM